MKLKHTVKTAYEGLMTNRSRSFLTVLGVVIGVAAIIIVMAVGDGARALILDEVSGLGPETVIVRPGSGVSDFSSTFVSNSLTQDDVEALQNSSNVPNLKNIHPYVIVSSAVEYRGDSYRPTMFGGSASFFAGTLDIDLADGEFYTQEDIDSNARKVVIGQDVKEDLFGLSQAVGSEVTIQNRNYEVVGVFADAGQIGGFNFDNMVMMPQTAAHNYITGDDAYQEIIIQADEPENVDKLIFDIKSTLRAQHDLDDGDEDDFYTQTQQNIIDQISTITAILSAFLIAMLSVALLVGGIGIMNIMLVSVVERTKEIGLRKALGATNEDIQKQFLFEAVMLTAAGGVIGVAAGALIAWVASVILSSTVISGWSFVFPVSGALLGVGVSMVIGLIFGIYPARQAAKKSPIEALRYE